MIGFLKDKPRVLVEATRAKFKPHPLVQILIFLGLLLVARIVIAIPAMAIRAIRSSTYGVTEYGLTWWTNILLVLGIGIYVLYVKFIEKRPLSSMGFRRKGALKQYCLGFLLGIAMIAAALGISMLAGGTRYEGIAMTTPAGILLLWFVGFIIQGMSEEVTFRGYYLVSASLRMPVMWAVVISSVIFASLHLFNKGINVLSFTNLLLYGLFTAFYFLRTNNIWGIAAQHSAWNYVQGNIFGIPVSGTHVDARLFSFANTGEADIVSGGGFGLVGGLAVTAVFMTAILLTLFLPRKSKTGMQSFATEC